MCVPVYSLTPFHSLRLISHSEKLLWLKSESQLPLAASASALRPHYLLGGGTNVVLPRFLAGTVILVRMGGIQRHQEKRGVLELEVGAGVNWDWLVRWTLSRGYRGLENLILIPGTVGGAPIQNIGAYGAQISQLTIGVRYYHFDKKRFFDLSQRACQFRYRDSIFKHELRGQGVITRVRLRLRRDAQPTLIHPALKGLYGRGSQEPSATEVALKVMQLRQKKLPDPRALPNVGSTFHNPIVPTHTLEAIRTEYPQVPYYGTAQGQRVPAAWFLEQAGFKGYQFRQLSMSQHHAGVLTHHGYADGDDVRTMLNRIQTRVAQRFGVRLRVEPALMGFSALDCLA